MLLYPITTNETLNTGSSNIINSKGLRVKMFAFNKKVLYITSYLHFFAYLIIRIKSIIMPKMPKRSGLV